MATSLTVNQLRVSVGWQYDNVHAFGNSSNANSFTYSKSLTDGSGASKANKIYLATVTIAAGGNLQVDLSGSLNDIYGNLLTFTRVKAVYFELATDTSSTSITVGGASSNAFVNWVADATDKVRIRNGGTFFLACTDATGYVVTAGTGDILQINNEDGSNIATIKMCIIGE